MVVLVTGGAGYIGRHVVRSLLSAGFTVTVVDDLSTGRAQVVPDDVPLSVCSVSDKPAMRAVFEEMSITGVVHLAALKSVEESERDPARYLARENVAAAWQVSLRSAETSGDPSGSFSRPPRPCTARRTARLCVRANRCGRDRTERGVQSWPVDASGEGRQAWPGQSPSRCSPVANVVPVQLEAGLALGDPGTGNLFARGSWQRSAAASARCLR